MDGNETSGIYGILSQDGLEHFTHNGDPGGIGLHRRACLDTDQLLDAVRKGFIRSVWCSDIRLLSANPNAALELTAFLDWHDVPLNIGGSLN